MKKIVKKYQGNPQKSRRTKVQNIQNSSISATSNFGWFDKRFWCPNRAQTKRNSALLDRTNRNNGISQAVDAQEFMS